MKDYMDEGYCADALNFTKIAVSFSSFVFLSNFTFLPYTEIRISEKYCIEACQPGLRAISGLVNKEWCAV